IADALELRRAKKRSAGVEAAALGAGDPLVAKERRADEERRRKDAEDGAWKIKKGGLQTVLVAENAFAKPSNAMDTERKMQEFIERELRRKTMQQQQQSEGGSAESLVVGNSDGGDNTNDQDFGDNPKQEVSEGNVAFSAAMLTSIPVVDLGISTKLKNIEETERAKRDII
ncbi:hepatocellular carcinoma-associated antigen 59-domain-containing protein, partial [Obelidium mucronatum]